MRRTLKGILGLAAVFSLTVAGGRYTFAQTGAQSEKTSSGIVIETRAADKDNESEKAAETAKNIESGKAADVAEKAESGETADTEKAAETEKDKESEDTADVGKDKKSSENKNENEHGHSEEISEDHEVPEGVTVNGMELGGMTVKAAEEKLQQYVDEVCGGAVTLSVNGDEVTISYKDFDMHVADSTVIQDICQIGVNGNLIKRYKELSDVKNNKAEYTLNFEYDHDKLKELVDEDTAEYNKDAQNASLVRHSGEFIITDDVTGMKVDIDATTKAVEEAAGKLKEAGARRTIMLNVSGPFHSKMLVPAGEKLAEELENTRFHELKIPYVTNVSAEEVTDIRETPGLLTTQISSPVRWMQSMERMIADGVDTFVEIGPGRTLEGFLRKINRNVKVFHISQWEDVDKVCEELADGGNRMEES